MPKTVEWAPSPDFPGHLLSEDGQVKSPRGKILRQRIVNGAYRVNIGKATAMVHTLMLRAWTGIPVKGYYPKHRNGVRTDNQLDNLVWAGRPS